MSSLPEAFVARLRSIFPSDRCYLDAVDCYAYSYDNSRKILPPDAVVFALDAAEIRDLILLCNAHGIPVTPRGRGTGTAGGSIPQRGGVVLSLERMRRIVAVDAENRLIVAEPGVLNQEIQAAAKPFGLFWPPDPSSAAYCSMGGNLATSAGGPHAVKYGTTRDHVLGLKAVTGAGEIVRAGCYTTKGVVGYDLTRLIIGSEGTLAVITEATLKLTPLPLATGGIAAHYRDAESCAQAIIAVMGQSVTPSALEFLDSGSLNLIRSRNPGMLPDESRAMLMIEVDGAPRDIAESCSAIMEACGNSGLIDASRVNDARELWAARRALSPLLRDIAPKKINEDIVVPVSRLPELLSGLEKLSSEYGIANVNFGHAGNGNIHVNLLVDPDKGEEMERAGVCLERVFDLVLSMKGTLSGEHGVGREKMPYVPKEIDAATLDLMRRIKSVFDPKGILNPGKIFPG